jgi:hypothetical protein
MMKTKDIITITREVNGSTGYLTFLAALENLVLVSIDTDPAGYFAEMRARVLGRGFPPGGIGQKAVGGRRVLCYI